MPWLTGLRKISHCDFPEFDSYIVASEITALVQQKEVEMYTKKESSREGNEREK